MTLSIVEVKLIKQEGKKFFGIKVDLGNAPLLIIKGERGYVMCGYLNIDVAEKLGDVAAMVRGVKTIDEMLDKDIYVATSKAKELGIKEGMKVREILKLL
ncbi:MAG: DUF1805 domain-containing protein [Thermoprotei archaeon]|nr:MAG: DUF1805 domain-containing protein [Thermoprotei archaeon]